jgi:hypothetical protein
LNLFNHSNFAYPNQIIFSGSAHSSSAGQVTSTATTSRQIQLVLKVIF